MNWQSINFDWNHVKAFLVTAEEGSLSAAAKALGSTQPTLGRQVNSLEQSLNVQLFERVGRGLVLTESGKGLLSHVKNMGFSANQISLYASGHSEKIAGNVCISASEIYATLALPSVLVKLREKYPGIQIEIVSSNEVSDIQRREADIAIRSFRPTESELIAKKLKDVVGYFYATPEYIEKLGKISKPKDLKKAGFISVGNNTKLYIQRMHELGLAISEDNFAVKTQSHLVHWELTKQGLGIGIVPSQIGDAEPSVERLMPEKLNMSFSVWLTTHQELRTSKRIKVVFDFLAKHLIL